VGGTGQKQKELAMKQVSNLVTLTEGLLRSGMKGGLGMKRSQAAALGIPWPLRAGWMEAIVGASVSEEDFAAFMGERDAKARKWKPRRRRNEPRC